MAWGLTDDKLHSHRKTLRIPRSKRCESMGLWTLVNSWCNDHGTDGAVPRDIWDEFGTTVESAELLVAAGFWEDTAEGYQVVNWAEYNKTSAELDEKRTAEAERKRKWREEKARKAAEEKARSEGSPPNVPAGQAGPSDDVPSESALTHTHTHTQLKDMSEPPASNTPTNSYPAEFEKFWAAYPRKEQKRDASKAWQAALKRASNEELIEGATRYGADPNRESQYTKLPAGWLRADMWLDGPIQGKNGNQVRDGKSGLLVER
ncbi:hypothetical protein FFI94_018780 [Rhodococcus sp. KBS0724]|uniref:hypothetical protein n=1 Tax=Rhodococcus sp. KBS0724 TaxID=1179674 RepID=UPI00110D9E1A|nr:hypothetical protein [Rhodococcus sp. KBS0724]TSD47962.1 hypothetical protein FFI94_018780 [Rhodococcus sp. KBS0724]